MKIKSGRVFVGFFSNQWLTSAVTLTVIQVAFVAFFRGGAVPVLYAGILDGFWLIALLVSAGAAARNAICSSHSIRLFWAFISASCLLWADNAWNWVYYVAILHYVHPDYLSEKIPLFLQPIVLIAAVLARPHVKLSSRKPYRTTLDFLQLLLFGVFVYAFILFPVTYMEWNRELILRGILPYGLEDLLMLAVLGVAAARVRSKWRGMYLHLLGASTLFVLGAAITHFQIIRGTSSASLDNLIYAAATCWLTWFCVRGYMLAPQLAESVQTTRIDPNYTTIPVLLAGAVIPLVGMWELFRVDELSSNRQTRVIIVLFAIFLFALMALITEYFNRREVSSSLQLADERLGMALMAGKSMLFERDTKTGVGLWIGDLENILGVSSEAFSASIEGFAEFVHPEDRQGVSDAIREALKSRGPYAKEFRIVRRDGKTVWVAAAGHYFYAKDGNPARLLGMTIDITERKLAELALKKSEEKFSKLFLQSPMAITITSLKDNRYLDVNEAFERYTGWSREEVIGHSPFDFKIWDEPNERIDITKQVQRDGTASNIRFRFRRRDGTERRGLGAAEVIELEGEPILLATIEDVTDLEIAQEKLRENEQRLRAVVDYAMDAIIAIDEQQRVVLFNSAAEKMFRCVASDAMGASIERFIPPRFRSQHNGHIRRFGESGVTNRGMGTIGTLLALRANGEEFPIEASISRLEQDGKKLFTVIIRDVSDRRKAEDALRSSEQRLRLAFQAAKMYAYEWDARNDTIVRSPEFADVLGRDQPLETRSRDLLIQVHPDDRDLLKGDLAEFTPERDTSAVQYRLLYPNGTMIWMERRARATFDEERRLERIIGVVADITNQKITEAALKESEERFRLVVENISDAVIVDDTSGRVVFANDRFYELFGLNAGKLAAISLEDYVAPEYRGELRERHNRRMRGEPVPAHFEYEGLRTDGTRIWIEVDVVPVTNEMGQLIGSQSAIRDISGRKQVLDALRESEERFRLVANTAPVLIWMTGPDNARIYLNQTWLEFTGRPIEAELGNGWEQGVHPEDLAGYLKVFADAVERREMFKAQYRLLHRDGAYRFVLDTGVPRLDPSGSFAGYIGSCIDITNLKLAAEVLKSTGRRLIQAHEEERTHFARELHDDINQRIALLSLDFSRIGKKLLNAPVELRNQLAQAHKALSEIAGDIQALSHRLHSSKLEYLGLAKAANSFCMELAEKQQVRIEFTASEMPSTIPHETALCLFRVLQESLRNALKHSGTRHFRVELRSSPTEIQLAVTDTGQGFNPDEMGNQRGIGLVSMRERLQLVGGQLSIDSAEGRGTTVSACVPL